MTMITKDENKAERTEVRKALDELDNSIKSVTEIVGEFENRLNSVFRELPTIGDGELEKNDVQRFTAPLALEIERHAHSIYAQRDKISGMLSRLEL